MQEVYDFANEKMTKSVKSLHNEYVSMRAGKASVSLLDKVVVDYYGWLPYSRSADGCRLGFRGQKSCHSAVGRKHYKYH
jgi:hypothetical protein